MLPDSQQEKQHRLRNSKEDGVSALSGGGGDTMTLQDERRYELRRSEIPRVHGEAARKLSG